MAVDVSWHGVLRGLLVLGLLWWSWVCYAWLGNVVKADEGVARVGMFGAMAAMFVLALAIPEAFDDAPGGLSGPVVIAVCYFVFRAIHLVLFWVISRDDATLRGQVGRFTPSMLSATVLLLVAGLVDGWAQTALWGAAVVADYLGNLLGGAQGWRLRSVDHFAERHRRIVLVAMGVSLAGVGGGITGTAVSAEVVSAAVLGLALAAAMWWAYFDRTASRVEHSVAAVAAADRPHVARDVYSYLHLPLIAGIVLVALGLRRVFADVGPAAMNGLTDPIGPVGRTGLLGGVAVFLLGAAAFVFRVSGSYLVARLVVAAVLIVLIPLTSGVSAVALLAVGAVAGVLLVAFETRQEAADGVAETG